MSEFKYLRCVLDEAGTYEAVCHRNLASRRRVAGSIRSLVNARALQLQCTGVLHESLLGLVLMYGNETMIWNEKKRSRIKVEHMNNFIGLLGVRRMGKVPNVRIIKLCGVTKGFMKVFSDG